MAKQLSDYGTGMKDIIMTQLARERQAAWDNYNLASAAKELHGMRVRHYNFKMRSILLRIATDQYDLGA